MLTNNHLSKKTNERPASRPSLVVHRAVWLAALLFLFFEKTAAQNPTDGGRPTGTFPQQPGSSGARPDTVPVLAPPEPPDTTPLRFSFCQKPETLLADADTLPGAGFRFYDPARRGYLDREFSGQPFAFLPPGEWANLGNPGSAARPLFYRHFAKTGFQTGANAFNLYETAPDQLRFYEHPRAFTEAIYTQGYGQQGDSQFRGRFARTFADGTNCSFQADALNGFGQFSNQRNKNSALAAGLWQQYGSRYEAFLIFAQNSHREQENGGIVRESELLDPGLPGGNAQIVVAQNAPVPVTSLVKTDLQFTQHLLFFGKKSAGPGDSTARKTAGRNDFRLVHSARLGTETFKFYDKYTAKDSAFYGPFWTDERAIRTYFQTKTVENRVNLAFSTGKKTGGGLEVGLKHQFVRLDRESSIEHFQQLFLTGKAAFRIANRVSLNSEAELGFGKTSGGEYSLRAGAAIDLGPLGTLHGGLLNQRRQPSLVERGLEVAQIPVYSNDFKKIFETTLAVGWGVPRLGFSVAGQNHLCNNFVFFNQKQLPEQLGSALNVAQLVVNQNFKLWKLRLDNELFLQKTNQPAALHQPEWATRNSLYFDGKVFHQHLHLSAGADFRMSQAFAADAWQPAAGQFHLQDSLRAGGYPSVDVFAAMNVKNFRFFIRYENLSKWWENRVFYQTAAYPQPRAYIRFGASFRWLDLGKSEAKAAGKGSSQPGQRPSGPSGGRPF